MRYPRKLRPGAASDLLLSNADLMPTFAALAAAEIPSGVHGANLSRQIFNGGGTEPNSTYVSGKLGTPGEWRMVVRGLDKAVFDNQDRLTHLYNLGQDPFEQFNRAGETGPSRLRDELRAHLRTWRSRTAHPVDASGLRIRK
jgi:arylsulfatase A-like enzyme